jgi:hypothetical protein
MRTLCPISLHSNVKSLVGCPVVAKVTLLDMTRLHMTLLNMARLDVLLCGIAWLSMGLGDMGVLVNRLRVLLNVVLLAALTDLVEGSSDKMHKTREVSKYILN